MTTPVTATEHLDEYAPTEARSTQEIAAALATVVDRYQGFAGSEVSEAQSFLNDLFAAYGVDRRRAGVTYEQAQRRPDGSIGFVDALWPGRVLIEMKRPTEAHRLEQHWQQAHDYWLDSADRATGVEATRYTVLCAFQRFLVYDFARFPRDPVADFRLEELPDRQGALRFLAGQPPTFAEPDRQLTTAAAEIIVSLYHDLVARRAAEADELQRFILQTVWCLFASDLGVLSGYPAQEIVEDLLRDQRAGFERRSSAAELGHLFWLLNVPDQLHTDRPTFTHQQQGGIFAGKTKFVNGGLFAKPATVHLRREELEKLSAAGGYRWREVDPTIFGSLLEGFLQRDRAIVDPGARSRFGIHFTAPDDIRKLIIPTIVEPWQQRIEAAKTISEAEQVLRDLCGLRVLDPACGSGNFLYIAYQEIRKLEQRAHSRVHELANAAGVEPPDLGGLQYPLANLTGIELDDFAIQVARVVVWMGHEVAGRSHGTPEALLPLPDLSRQLVRADALAIDWPPADVIIGNPPFIGSRRLRRSIGDEAVTDLIDRFNCGVRDYCVYWFRKAAEHLPSGGRAGLVATNSISQHQAREASLDYVMAQGGIFFDVVPSQQWQGDANVHVSLINWIQNPSTNPTEFRIDHSPVPEGIGADLRPKSVSVVDAKELGQNSGIAFQGPIPGNDGFILEEDTALSLLHRDDIDYGEVIRRYLSTRDLIHDPQQRPARWIIDFGHRTLEEAKRFTEALNIVDLEVRPERQRVGGAANQRHWWLFVRPRGELREVLRPLSRYLVIGAHGKRTIVCWMTPEVLPSNSLIVIGLDRDYHYGVLNSSAHLLWAGYRGSTIKSDPRYTPTTVFRSFPWPDPDSGTVLRIEAAARELLAQREAACAYISAGLTEVYNLVEEGGFEQLAAAHEKLDRAVAAAYGWPEHIIRDPYEIIPRLMERNAKAADGRVPYDPFADHPSRHTGGGSDSETLW